jgi:hypothetical protein
VDPLQATVQQARELLLAVRSDVDAMGEAWWNLVRSVGYIAGHGDPQT